jgi:hypothetical protein
VQEPVNYSGVHAALSCEILARQGTHNDHLIQWLMVEFRRSELGGPDSELTTSVAQSLGAQDGPRQLAPPRYTVGGLHLRQGRILG